jgi:OTU domain-containing protein 5
MKFIIFKVKNADFFRAYITEDFDHYITRKRRQNCHGNHIEMIALSELYNRPIEVYEYSIGNYLFYSYIFYYLFLYF